MTYYYFLLLLAGVSEVIWAYYMKKSEGLTKLTPSVLFISFNIASTILLALALKEIPVSVGYPIWTGIGALGTVILGMYAFKERTNFKKILFLILIMIGIVGLKTL